MFPLSGSSGIRPWHRISYKDKASDPFVQRTIELNASDGLHPSDAGYLLWYRELQAQAHLSDRLRKVEQ